jgi:hypothetical protein
MIRSRKSTTECEGMSSDSYSVCVYSIPDSYLEVVVCRETFNEWVPDTVATSGEWPTFTLQVELVFHQTSSEDGFLLLELSYRCRGLM